MKKCSVEEWRSLDFIEGLEGYAISNLGRLKSFRRSQEGRILKPSLVSNGYWAEPISVYGEVKLYYIHYLVARAFSEICGVYEPGKVVHHISGDFQANNPENLVWLTPQQHQRIHATQRRH